jgi:chlorobactene glucosyltransferase
VRSHVVEDVSLGRAVAARIPDGERLFNCEALHFSEVRMYRSFGETWEGFTKNMRAVFDDQRVGFWLFGVVAAACFLGPFVAVFSVSGAVRLLVLAQIAVIFGIRFLLAARFRTSWAGALLHPVGVLLLLLIGMNSWRRSTGAGVLWKGRIYKPQV